MCLVDVHRPGTNLQKPVVRCRSLSPAFSPRGSNCSLEYKNSAAITVTVRLWLGAHMDRGFRSGVWQRGTEGRTISIDVPVSLHSTPGSASQSSGVFSSEGLNGNIGIAVWTDNFASSPRGFRLPSAALQY